MDGNPQTTEARLRAALPALTPTEGRLARHVLSHFPVSALGSITALARAADVSTPTVVRLMQRLGFAGYGEFQALLRSELGTMLSAVGQRPAPAASPDMLARFAAAAARNIDVTLAAIDPATFTAVAALLAEPARPVHAMGGRITHVLADYLTSLLRVARPGVALLSDASNGWPPAMLDMGPRDVLILFDIRRYEGAVTRCAEAGAQAGAEVVLVTDRGASPAAAHARHVLHCSAEVPGVWDSTTALVVLIEALVAEAQARMWPQVEARLARMEEVYARTGMFRPAR